MTTTEVEWTREASRFGGRLIRRGEPGYEKARVRNVFNVRYPGRYPEAILQAISEDDIVQGIRFAKEQGWKIAIRAGGHSFASWSIRDDALLIDLYGFKEISYDEATQCVCVTAAVQGGGELSPYLERLGRFFPGGHCTDVGLGGFLLQGGMGWNTRGLGWAAERIVAIDVVTADGELVRADAANHPDLFWAARGAGPGFCGVVTRFYLQTLPNPKALTQTTHVYPIAEYDAVMRWLLDIHADISLDVEVKAYAMSRPDEVTGKPVFVLNVVGLAFVDTPKDAQKALAPFSTCPVLDKALVRLDAVPTSFTERYTILTAANPRGYRWFSDNAWLQGSAADVSDAMRRLFCSLPSPQSIAMFFSIAPLRELPDMALSLQTPVYCASYVIYPDEKDDEKMKSWLRTSMRDMEPITQGQYLGDADQTNRQVKFMGDEQWKRLRAIYRKYDPTGRFVSYLTKSEDSLNSNEWTSN